MNGELNRIIDDLEARETDARDLFHEMVVAAAHNNSQTYMTARHKWEAAHNRIGLIASVLAGYKLEVER